jgi:hypothetical protein
MGVINDIEQRSFQEIDVEGYESFIVGVAHGVPAYRFA